MYFSNKLESFNYQKCFLLLGSRCKYFAIFEGGIIPRLATSRSGFNNLPAVNAQILGLGRRLRLHIQLGWANRQDFNVNVIDSNMPEIQLGRSFSIVSSLCCGTVQQSSKRLQITRGRTSIIHS